MNFLRPDWCGLTWVPFVPFAAAGGFRGFPVAPGLYKIRVADQPRLAYIGQTGRDLRERVGSLRLHALGEQFPFADPHTAAQGLWSYRHADGLEFECSVTPMATDQPTRLAAECHLIWSYRREAGCSPLCSFARLHHHYRRSGPSKSRRRGGVLDVKERPPCAVCSEAALQLVGGPTDPNWMGLEWSSVTPLIPRFAAGAPAAPGVYRIVDMAAGQVIYFGESCDLRDRLGTHCASHKKLPVVFSWCALPALVEKWQRVEVENDLVAGFFEVTRGAPRLQFGAPL